MKPTVTLLSCGNGVCIQGAQMSCMPVVVICAFYGWAFDLEKVMICPVFELFFIWSFWCECRVTLYRGGSCTRPQVSDQPLSAI